MTLYDEEGNEVEAFTQKEVDAKVKESIGDIDAKVKASEDALKEKTKEFDDLSKQYEDKKNSYSELTKKSKEDGEKYKEVLERDKKAYTETVESKIKEIAGDDKEYAEAIKKQMEREGVGFQTNDSAEIDKQFKEAQALTNIELSREVKSPVGDGGVAPNSPDGSATDYTETTEGKNTFDTLSDMMGLPAETDDNK